MTMSEMKQAIEWLADNRLCRLRTYLSNNFVGLDWEVSNLITADKNDAINSIVDEMLEYDLSVQLEIVELMY